MITQTKEGYWIVKNDSHIGAWVEQSGRLDHDQNSLPVLFNHVRPGDTVIDIGALYGDHTIAYSDWVGPQGKVIAIECNPEALQCLRLNMNGRSNVQVIDKALWSETGKLKLTRSVNAGASFVTLDPKGDIDAVSLDSLFIPQVNYMKIDAEGCETEILKGAKDTIAHSKPIICMEINEGALQRNGSSSEELLSLLKDLGYKWEKLFPGENNADQYDIIAHFTP